MRSDMVICPDRAWARGQIQEYSGSRYLSPGPDLVDSDDHTGHVSARARAGRSYMPINTFLLGGEKYTVGPLSIIIS